MFILTFLTFFTLPREFIFVSIHYFIRAILLKKSSLSSRIASFKLAFIFLKYLQGILLTAFRVFHFPRPNIMGTEWQPGNACRAISDEVTLWWDDTIDLLMLMLSSVKTSIYSFANDKFIFLKHENRNTDTLILRCTILSIAQSQ